MPFDIYDFTKYEFFADPFGSYPTMSRTEFALRTSILFGALMNHRATEGGAKALLDNAITFPIIWKKLSDNKQLSIHKHIMRHEDDPDCAPLGLFKSKEETILIYPYGFTFIQYKDGRETIYARID